MASSAPVSATDVSSVPEWVEKNSKLFKTLPVGFHPRSVESKRVLSVAEREAIVAAVFKPGTRTLDNLNAAIGTASATDDTMGNMDLPTGPQKPEYWKNVDNHGNILATLIVTARRKSGFVPSVSSANFSKEEAQAYTKKFNAWMAELDSYVGYLTLVDFAQQTKTNNTTDCSVILKGVTEFVLTISGVAGAIAQKLAAKVAGLITSAASYTTQTGNAVNAGFTLETVQTTGGKDPIQPITFTSTIMSKTKAGKSVSEESSVTLAYFVYKLNSNAIISMADELAKRSTLSGAKQYIEYVNGPLNDFQSSGTSAP